MKKEFEKILKEKLQKDYGKDLKITLIEEDNNNYIAYCGYDYPDQDLPIIVMDKNTKKYDIVYIPPNTNGKVKTIYDIDDDSDQASNLLGVEL